jgi:hypothetical protein
MASKFLQRLTLAAVLVGGLGLLNAHPAAATRPVRRTARPQAARGFNLFAGAVNVVMNVNRVQCNINNIGEACVDPTNSSTVGGGYWPKGTPDQYVFNAGLMIGATLGGSRASFPWAGDTVGAFIFDPIGSQASGEGLTNVMNGLSVSDLAEWPTAAYVNDPTLFNSALLGRRTVSQQDTWVRYWDGNTQLTSGRQHPMGLLIDQRGLMWNFPSGNQDIVYFLYRFINITASDAAKYDNLADFGYSAADIADIVTIARDFQARSEATFNISLPDSGWTFTNMMAGLGQDPDVGQSGQNYSTAILPFAMGVAYKSNFYEPTWSFPADIFGAPFAAAPGFVGTKYLKSPTDPATGRPFGITMFTNTTNSAVFPDRRGVQALWRLLSGNLTAVDGTCTVDSRPVSAGGRGMCALIQTQDDTRFVQASGPFTMAAGQSQVIVVAILHGAPVASFTVAGVTYPLVEPASDFDMLPAIPGSATRLADGIDTIRTLDRAAGWVHGVSSFVNDQDLNADGYIDQTEVPVVPRSLLGKARVAQAVFDAKFLLPFAPESPAFYTIPGDEQVTIAWQPSGTETTGDPYHVVAEDVLNSLYDSNFRRYDVEGYRIWRGRTEATMEVVASFDLAGTTMTDHTGQFWTSADYGTQCAPELGITTTCPVAFLPDGSGPTHDVLLAGEVIQVPPGGRVELASGSVLIVAADTAVTGGNSGLPALTDNGVPFAYVDREVRNGFRYFYAVTAFDVNSVASGPSSLESPLTTKQATPRASGSNNTPAVVLVGVYGSDSTRLDTEAGFPSIDAATGTFNGILPPANGGTFGFLASVAEALPPGEYVARIDSIDAGIPASLGTEPTMYVTFSAPGVTTRMSFPVPFSSHSSAPTVRTNTYDVSTPLVPYDTMRARVLGIPLSFSSTARMPVSFSLIFAPIVAGPSATMLCGRGLVSATNCGTTMQASRYLLHSRWFDEGGAEPPDPTISFNPSPDHNSGKLTGVTNIWSPLAYRVPLGAGGSTTRVPAVFRYYSYAVTGFYPADFVVTWGAGGAITVRDSTHHTDLPYNRGLGTGWGFISGAAIAAAGVTTADLQFEGNVELGAPNPAVPSYHSIYTARPVCDGALRDGYGEEKPCADLSRTAVLQGLDFSNPADGVSDGNGIALAVNGEVFFMNMTALPAAGTKWHLRAIGGLGMTATCTPALPAGTGELLTPPTDCSNYAYSPVTTLRPPIVPGLQYKMVVSQGFENAAASGDLSMIHTVPDPYYVTNQLEITASTKVLRFVNLPDRAIIRIYSVSGILVNVLTHNNPAGGGEEVWNLRNRNNQFVASGAYFYHVETPDGQTKIGRFTVVNYAQ